MCRLSSANEKDKVGAAGRVNAHKWKGNEYPLAEAHPAADKYPLMLGDPTFGALRRSIRKGYDASRPILKDAAGRIISGRRRHLACLMGGIDPQPYCQTVNWSDRRIVRFLTLEHHLQRPLTPGQRAAVAVQLVELRPRGGCQSIPSRDGMDSAKAIAREFAVSPRVIEAAAKIKKLAPELLPVVADKKLPVRVAEQLAGLPLTARRSVLKSADLRKAAADLLGRTVKDRPGETHTDAGDHAGTRSAPSTCVRQSVPEATAQKPAMPEALAAPAALMIASQSATEYAEPAATPPLGPPTLTPEQEAKVEAKIRAIPAETVRNILNSLDQIDRGFRELVGESKTHLPPGDVPGLWGDLGRLIHSTAEAAEAAEDAIPVVYTSETRLDFRPGAGCHEYYTHRLRPVAVLRKTFEVVLAQLESVEVSRHA